MAETRIVIPGKPKPIWWRVVVGGLLMFVEVGNIFGRAQPLTGNPDQVAGMKAMEVILLLLGVWLFYSGTQPLRTRTPNCLHYRERVDQVQDGHSQNSE